LITPDQTKTYVDIVFKSAGDRKDLYRVVLKKAILDNIESLSLLEKGRLETAKDPLINLVMENLDHNDRGLITQKELKDAVVKVAKENNVYLDDQSLAEIVVSSFLKDDGSVAKEMSR
jgi:division protein CdvB (Snf7/Vps24/ESCRT-III family)